MSNFFKRAALHNLGCKVNSYETDAMRRLLWEAGYTIVPFEEEAEVYVVNTCSVTNIADRKSRQLLHRAKKRNPEAIVVAAGCYVQTHGEQVEADEAVDLIIDNSQKEQLVERLAELLGEAMPVARGEEVAGGEEAVAGASAATTKAQRLDEAQRLQDTLPTISDHTRAFIKVQDGCNQFCSYCIIPYARGRVTSREPQAVVEEIAALAAAGYQEFVITGIHLSSYGLQQAYNVVFAQPVVQEALLELLRQVAAIPGVRRIRLGSLEPQVITEEFARQLSQIEGLCPQFHLSMQSGCAETLCRMNRRYTPQEYLQACTILRKHFRNPAITTDVIVGFPGETEEEFAATVAFVEQVAFAKLHVFPYSKREGTPAAKMVDQVPEHVKKARSEALLKLDSTMGKAFADSYLGQRVEVLFETAHEQEGQTCYTGYTREYLGVQLASQEDLTNSIVEVELTRDILRS